MSDVIGVIIIILFLVLLFAFYKSLTWRKKEEEIYAQQLKVTNFELQKKCDKLQADLDHIQDHKVEKILNHKNKKFFGLEKTEAIK